MAITNVAARLGVLIDTAYVCGQGKMTEPTADIWAAAFKISEPDAEEIFAALATTHRNLRQLQRLMSSANPILLAESQGDIKKIAQAFGPERLDIPWNNTRRLLDDRVRITLRACAAALDGRFDERMLNADQARVADQLLANFIQQIRAESLPPHIEGMLLQAIAELRRTLESASVMGVEVFTAKADHLLGEVGRALTPRSAEQPAVQRLIRGLGILIASVSTAVTLGLGIVELDQQTLNLLPWGDQVDQAIVTCVVEANDPPALESHSGEPLTPTHGNGQN